MEKRDFLLGVALSIGATCMGCSLQDKRQPTNQGLIEHQTVIRQAIVDRYASIGGPESQREERTKELVGLKSQWPESWIELLKDSDNAVAREAASALGDVKCRQAVRPLIEALLRDYDDKSEYVNEAAAMSLGQIGDPAAIDALIQALEFDTPIAEAAVCALGEIADPKAVIPLNAVVHQNRHEELTKYAIGALGILRDRRSVEVLIESLGYENHRARICAVGALAAIGDKRAIPPMVRLLDEDAGVVRIAAARALVRFGPLPEVILALKNASKDDNPEVAQVAAQCLQDLRAGRKS